MESRLLKRHARYFVALSSSSSSSSSLQQLLLLLLHLEAPKLSAL
jgi:hypothetical protein